MSFYKPYFSKTILLCCTYRILMMLCGLCFKHFNIYKVFLYLEQFVGLIHFSSDADDLKMNKKKSSLCCEITTNFMLLILDFYNRCLLHFVCKWESSKGY